MKKNNVSQIIKRNGDIVPFDAEKIFKAIDKALTAVGKSEKGLARKLGEEVVGQITNRFHGSIPSVENVQDIVEEVLMRSGFPETARAYILYREKRTNVRELKNSIGVRDDLKLSVNAVKVLKQRYLIKDKSGKIIETPRRMFERVAETIAAVERKRGWNQDTESLEQQYFDMMSSLDFLPNSPTLMNAGTDIGQLSACFVLPVEDSIIDIFESLKNMAVIHQSGGGTGFSFNHLRPKGDIVRSTGGVASGPVSFMQIFNAATEVIKQGGRRRGANMGILRCDHPDIMEFIQSKTEENNLSNFNISVAITNDFMDAVFKDLYYPLINPRTGKSTNSVKAKNIFDSIVYHAWSSGDPGIIFIDRINADNPTPEIGQIEATNPCGELPLLPYESCNLGSINLSQMVYNGEFNREKISKLVKLAVRFLDDVIETNALPLKKIEKITVQNRKIGLGIMGFADALIKLEIPYDSKKAMETASSIISFIAAEAKQASEQLAVERGPFPNFKNSSHYHRGGRPLRNAALLSIAPTGSISILANCSSGIEPLFALSFIRNIMEGSQLLEVNPLFEETARKGGFYSESLMKKIASSGNLKGIIEIPEDVRRLFVTDWDIHWSWHVKMQAAFQRHVDNSVSKTINLPHEASVEDVRQAFLMAYETGCKGITVYRYGVKKEQVLNLGRHMQGESGTQKYTTAQSEYSGGCLHETCDF